MPVNLQMTAINLDPNDVNFSGQDYIALLKDLQGNLLKGHGRNFSAHLFLTFNQANLAGIKEWIAKAGSTLVTSAFTQLQDTLAFKASGVDGGLFANFCLSAAGYGALGFSTEQLPDDPSFLAGAKQAQQKLNDPPVADWQQEFQAEIHALLILADDSEQVLETALQAVLKNLTGLATVVGQERGAVFRNERGQVIEHFGFADGVSQPLFLSTDLEQARLSGGFDRYDPSAPLGLVLLKDPNGQKYGYGSYLVYRKLAQDVYAFRAQEQQLANALGLSEQQAPLAGAYVVGRFRDGTPVVDQAMQGAQSEPNNFNYDSDVDGLRCPFHAHTRKTNPRGDKVREFGLPLGEDRSRRIARRAISFGPLELLPPRDVEVGLLFLCVQSSIIDQFEFMQQFWANFPIFLRPGTGADTVIGEPDAGHEQVKQHWPKTWGRHSDAEQPDGKLEFGFAPTVSMRGGEYFFVPSIGFLEKLS